MSEAQILELLEKNKTKALTSAAIGKELGVTETKELTKTLKTLLKESKVKKVTRMTYALPGADIPVPEPKPKRAKKVKEEGEEGGDDGEEKPKKKAAKKKAKKDEEDEEEGGDDGDDAGDQ